MRLVSNLFMEGLVMSYGKITEKQQEILDYMKAQIINRGFPPSVREICEAVHLKSTSSVHAHLESLEQKGYTHGSIDRAAGWIADIDSNNTLGYFCSSWGLNFDLMPNADTTRGDWQMCKAPIDYFKGGTWLASVEGCTHKDNALDFIKYVTTNEDFLTKRGKETGDFMNSKKVMSELVKDYSCEFLGGQNHLEILYEVAENINGELISPYDARIDSEFVSAVGDFAQANCSDDDGKEDPVKVEQARQRFKASFVNAVRAGLPAIGYR